jgi:hypothetical protein
MKANNVVSIAVFSLALGLLFGKSMEYYRTKDLQDKRTVEYVKILADNREVYKTLDRLKSTIAKKCNEQCDNKYIPNKRWCWPTLRTINRCKVGSTTGR